MKSQSSTKVLNFYPQENMDVCFKLKLIHCHFNLGQKHETRIRNKKQDVYWSSALTDMM